MVMRNTQYLVGRYGLSQRLHDGGLIFWGEGGASPLKIHQFFSCLDLRLVTGTKLRFSPPPATRSSTSTFFSGVMVTMVRST